MAALVRPAVLPVCAMRSGGGDGGSGKLAPGQQRSWWGGSKQRLPHQPRRQPGGNGGRGGALDQVLGVLRRDGEFLQAAAGAPLRDIFWLRFLEKKQRRKQPKPKPKPPEQQQEEEEAAAAPRQGPSVPPPSYPPGLSCLELMAADFEALKLYIGYSKHAIEQRFLGTKGQPQHQEPPKPKLKQKQKQQQHEEQQEEKYQTLQPPAFPPPSYPPGLSCMELMRADVEALKLYINYYVAILTTPLPQHYDPELLSRYFTSRPHILAFRTIQIIFAFVSGAVKMQISKRANLITDATNSGNSIRSKGFDASQYMFGQLLKETFLDLGPTFVKVGQSLSTRPDITGSEISEALAELHEKVPPFPREDAMKIIEGEFELPVSHIFSYISDEPVAAASFGQVYQGRTIDGALVAIKVQRPNLLPSVLRDIYILRLGLSFVRKIAKRKSNIALYADELGKGFVGELDYNIEAANATKFLEFHSRYSFMMVPKVLRQLTRRRVLTMEWVSGENPTDLLSLSKGISSEIAESSKKQNIEAKGRLLDLVNKGVEASLVQLLETGLLHADPHPGNLRYTPEGRVGFLDFGLLCMMEKKHQNAMLSSIMHIVNGDWASLVYDLTEMDVVPPRTNLRRVTMDLEDALGEVTFEDGIPDVKFSRVLGKIWSVAFKYHFRMPPYYTLVLRSLASLEGLAIAADGTFKTFQAAYPYVVRKLLSDNSVATRRLLHQAIFNKRKEFQWHKITAFLKLASARSNFRYNTAVLPERKGLDVAELVEISNASSLDLNHATPEKALRAANLCLRLFLAKESIVIRRLIMTANAKSLAHDLISKDASVFRVLISRVLADVIYQWMVKASGFKRAGRLEPHPRMATGNDADQRLSKDAPALVTFQTAVRDRRLRVIFSKFVRDIREDPILMIRVSWNVLAISVVSAAIGVHHFIVFLSEEFLTALPPPVRPPRLVQIQGL
ncbi:protein ACTIVITY OF BC1 COMPLEX KINASE 3, chloroplastic [Oryza brachyantha]|uniref:protein ACTIVITY OF BC1 COMPLEX KINASE 3, chloroplastic n=1 Tax=Oryza brachyantha TaxID=4533 RepID=UPI001ADBFE27|nr:protein ACTIVITY OF BC1 COMPLEX KINASE 3, chloroplastic [Oryza brachyantha]